jgi:hypothetical protein
MVRTSENGSSTGKRVGALQTIVINDNLQLSHQNMRRGFHTPSLIPCEKSTQVCQGLQIQNLLHEKR